MLEAEGMRRPATPDGDSKSEAPSASVDGGGVVKGGEDADAGVVVAPFHPEQFALFSKQESLEEELLYVATTLPVERPVAPLITPVRMRMMELKVLNHFFSNL